MSDPYPHRRVTGAFERRVAASLAPMVEAHGRVLVAVSGGADSTAALVACSRALGAERVMAAHFDHRLRSRADSMQDLAAVQEVVAALGVRLVDGRAGRRPSDASEEAARETRYRWLASAARRERVDSCVTGHTRDDQAETVLLRLARGTGAGGAAGMTPVARWPVACRGSEDLRVLRPLLHIGRAEVEPYLSALGIEPREDSTNADPTYARNRVRHRVLPELRTINTQASEHLASFAERQRADDAALQAWAAEELECLGRASGEGIDLDRRALVAMPHAVAVRCLQQAAAVFGIGLTSPQIEALMRAARRRGQRVDLGLAIARTDATLMSVRWTGPTRTSPEG